MVNMRLCNLQEKSLNREKKSVVFCRFLLQCEALTQELSASKKSFGKLLRVIFLFIFLYCSYLIRNSHSSSGHYPQN